MIINIFSDESGVFDKAHNEFFVFGGLIFLSTTEKDDCARKYIHIEKLIRENERIPSSIEVKASSILNSSKDDLYKSLNKYTKFGVVVHQTELLDKIFEDKMSKQRYLDWAYVYCVKKALVSLINTKQIRPANVERINFFVDEHTTATNGRYNLEQFLKRELKIGTFNYKANVFHSPIFPALQQLTVKFCNSQTTTLVRSADIVANRLYYLASNDKLSSLNRSNFHIVKHP